MPNESKTPETDRVAMKENECGLERELVFAEFARQLELSRDEARQQLHAASCERDGALIMFNEAKVSRDEWRELCTDIVNQVYMDMPSTHELLHRFRELKKEGE